MNIIASTFPAIHTAWGPGDGFCAGCEHSIGCPTCAGPDYDECPAGLAHDITVAGAHAAATGETEAEHVAAVVASGLRADLGREGWFWNHDSRLSSFEEDALVLGEPLLQPAIAPPVAVVSTRDLSGLSDLELLDLLRETDPRDPAYALARVLLDQWEPPLPAPDYFFGPDGADDKTPKTMFVPERAGEFIDGRIPTLSHPGGDKPLVYEGGRFVRSDDRELRLFREALGSRWRAEHETQLVRWLSHQPVVKPLADPELIVCANGVLNWRTGVLLPHSPDFQAITRLPVEWDPDATCPTYDATWAHLGPDKVGLLNQFAGSCLTTTTFKKALICHGPGDTGKSTWLNAVRRVFGEENCSSETLQDIAGTTWSAAQLHGKIANIAADLGTATVKASGTFKMLTGGDEVSAQRKYGQLFEFVFHGGLLFATNELPGTEDLSGAFMDRLMIVDFPPLPDGTVIDRSLGTKLAAEGPGILVRFVEGLRQLHAQGGFIVPASVTEAVGRYQEQANPALEWLATGPWERGDGSVPRRAAYSDFKSRWELEHPGDRAISAPRFYALLRGAGLRLEDGDQDAAGNRVIIGLVHRGF